MVKALDLRTNFIYSLLGRIVDSLGSIIVFWLLTRYLSLETYGGYGWIATIILTLSPILNLETSKIITKGIAEDRTSLHLYMASGFFIQVFLSLTFLCLTLGSGFIFIFSMKALYLPFLIAIINEIIFQACFIYVAAYYGIENLRFDFIGSFFQRIIGIAGVVIGITLNQGLTWFYASLTIGSLIKLIILFLGFSNHVSMMFIIPFNKVKELSLSIVKACYSLAIANLATSALIRVDAYVIKYLRGLESLALFHAPHQLILQAQIIPSIIIAPIYPIIVKGFKEGEAKVRDIYNNFMLLTFTVANIISFFIFGYSREILLVLGGSKFLPATDTLRVLSISLIPLFLILLNTLPLIIKGLQREILYAAMLGFTTNLILDLVLIPVMGNTGAGIATLTGYSTQTLFLIYNIHKRVFRINLFYILGFLPVLWLPFILDFIKGLPSSQYFFISHIYPFIATGVLLLSKRHRESLRQILRRS